MPFRTDVVELGAALGVDVESSSWIRRAGRTRSVAVFAANGFTTQPS
jgi:hypothetical protein